MSYDASGNYPEGVTGDDVDRAYENRVWDETFTPAARLLKAAEILEKRANEAIEGPWYANVDDLIGGYRVGTVNAPASQSARAEHIGSFINEPNARYIATMHPEVGKVLAAWLRDEGSFAQRGLGYQRRAEEVADLVLAGEQEQVEG
jgi:hypothetical protein